MIAVPLLAIAAVAALAAAPHATTLPLAAINQSGAVSVTLPAAMLKSKEVTTHLTSGLTTAFVVLVSCGDAQGAARVTVRYELWDETYFVTTLDAAGHEGKFTFPSAEKLAEWWGSTPLMVIRNHAPSPRAQITLKVLPFSAKEQAATQRWLSRILTSMGSVKDAPVDKRSDQGAAKILDVIVSTSIQRRPVLEYQWTVQARPQP